MDEKKNDTKVKNSGSVCGIIKRISFLILIFIIGCATVNQFVPLEITKDIPQGTKKIIILKNVTAENLYKEIYLLTIKEGFGVLNDNVELKSITTDVKDVEADTFLKMSIIVESTENGSKATITGKWQYGPQSQAFQQALVGYTTTPQWSDAEWKGSSDKCSMALAKMVVFAKEIPDSNINYQ